MKGFGESFRDGLEEGIFFRVWRDWGRGARGRERRELELEGGCE
jgi:hypothetical protein